MCSRRGDGLGGGGAGTIAGAGFGGGTGTGTGPGSGTGSGTDGIGPGAAEDGRGRGASGDDAPAPPAGDPEGTVVGGSAVATDVPTEGPAIEIEPPKFGFTAPEAPEFMGVKSKGKHVVYVIDRTLSMTETDGSGRQRFVHAQLELERSIEALSDDLKFSVIFFSAKSDVEPSSHQVMPPGRMLRATAQNKSSAIRWLKSQRPSVDDTLGHPSEALRAALLMKPDTVYFMTDGTPGIPYDKFNNVIRDANGNVALDWTWIIEAVNLVARLNKDHRTQVNTIAFHEQASEGYLKRMAIENGGLYRYVPSPTRSRVYPEEK
jgi:hypothetical protein